MSARGLTVRALGEIAILGHASIIRAMDAYGHLFESPEEDVALVEKTERDLMAA
ncbi:hypothetical protein [Halovulum dunhuangense]|uniref:hypothetical protein n=1 Tax=Halovulum dunhuangense TaxID=1505036 RepID=UPI001C0F1997|nr:hypothetical protein [Halovulum dunhuangense]